MGCIDAARLDSTRLNELLREQLGACGEVTVENPHSIHNIAAGLGIEGEIVIRGSTGFYTGGFMEGPSITVDGNAGWYVGDNMMNGEIIVLKNTGSNAGVYLYGGTLVIRGGTGSRVGYGMKGGTIIVCGSYGRWAGQQTLGGRLVLLGKAGKQIGESMYRGAIFVADREAEHNLGGNVLLDEIRPEEAAELGALFKKYDIGAEADKLLVIRPLPTGRHQYYLFKPVLRTEPEPEPAGARNA